MSKKTSTNAQLAQSQTVKVGQAKVDNKAKPAAAPKPIRAYRLHGESIQLKGYKPNDLVQFHIDKPEDEVYMSGVLRHVKRNDHSKNGYGYIHGHDGKIYERSVGKFWLLKNAKPGSIKTLTPKSFVGDEGEYKRYIKTVAQVKTK